MRLRCAWDAPGIYPRYAPLRRATPALILLSFYSMYSTDICSQLMAVALHSRHGCAAQLPPADNTWCCRLLPWCSPSVIFALPLQTAPEQVPCHQGGPSILVLFGGPLSFARSSAHCMTGSTGLAQSQCHPQAGGTHGAHFHSRLN